MVPCINFVHPVYIIYICGNVFTGGVKVGEQVGGRRRYENRCRGRCTYEGKGRYGNSWRGNLYSSGDKFPRRRKGHSYLTTKKNKGQSKL